MVELRKVKGIVLKSYSSLEKDVIGRLLTEGSNCLEVLAYGLRGSQKRSALILEPGALVKIDYYTRKDKLAILKEGHVENRFGELKNEYTSLLLLSYLLEVSSCSVSYGTVANLFLLVHGSLEELCRCHKEEFYSLELIIFFQARLMKLMGLLAKNHQCSYCERKLESAAQWKLPEIHFLCYACDPEANPQGLIMAKILDVARVNRFHNFKAKIEQKLLNLLHEKRQTKKILLALQHNLNSCLEYFMGRTFSSNKLLLKRYSL